MTPLRELPDTATFFDRGGTRADGLEGLDAERSCLDAETARDCAGRDETRDGSPEPLNARDAGAADFMREAAGPILAADMSGPAGRAPEDVVETRDGAVPARGRSAVEALEPATGIRGTDVDFGIALRGTKEASYTSDCNEGRAEGARAAADLDAAIFDDAEELERERAASLAWMSNAGMRVFAARETGTRDCRKISVGREYDRRTNHRYSTVRAHVHLNVRSTLKRDA